MEEEIEKKREGKKWTKKKEKKEIKLIGGGRLQRTRSKEKENWTKKREKRGRIYLVGKEKRKLTMLYDGSRVV